MSADRRPRSSRRQFLERSSAAAAAASVAHLAAAPAVHAAGDDILRVGLIGCGGRGTKAAVEALQADRYAQLTAMGDAFKDHLDARLDALKREENVAARINVPPERQFVGFDAYKGVIENSDVVLLTTPPHFRPLHLKAAVDAGKHCFVEKPVAVDGPGCRSVLETCKKAREKGLSVVSGLCMRYGKHFQETVKRIHGGQIGQVRTLFANDYRGAIWVKPRQPEWTDMQWQMRNWYYFTWLSGDFNVEQHVHMLDVCSWVIGKYPVKALGVGGRQVRTGAEYGHIYDHFSVIYEYDDGARLIATTRQQGNCKGDISSQVEGTKGSAVLSDRVNSITVGGEVWKYDGEKNNIYQTEHDEMFAGIRNSKPIDNGEYMTKSTMLAILGRMAAYTGQQITWDQAWNSKQDLTPPSYSWDQKIDVPEVARPGVTKFDEEWKAVRS